MKTIVQLIPSSAKGRRPGLSLVPEYITIHSTGNSKSTAKNEADNVCNNDPFLQSSFHIVVGDKEAYNVIPYTEIAWHAGDGYDGPGNRKSIALELVETGDREKVLRNAIEIIVALMRKYSIPLDHVVPHKRWGKKTCPRILLKNDFIEDEMDWGWFYSELQKVTGPSLSEAWAWFEKQGFLTTKKKTDALTFEDLALTLYQMQRKEVK